MWKFNIITVMVVTFASQIYGFANDSAIRDPKLFSMFQVIKFPNDPCVATNSRNGTCYTASECTTKSGTSAGTCASGFGVCCTFILGCGSSSSQNCTYVENSGAVAGTCKYSICKASSNICQLRLDFITFVITGPSTRTASVAQKITNPAGIKVSDATQCLTDIFTVTSPSNTVPVLCGTLTNDHIYLEASPACNDLTFSMGISAVTGTTTIPTRTWQIKVTQYNCDYQNRAPNGCLQYFFGTAATGTVRSFNWGATLPYHLANQKQSICVRQESGQCKICWYLATVTTDFQVSGVAAMTKGMVAPASSCCGYGAAGAATFGYDCVIIPGASKGTGAVKYNSICGRRLATSVITTGLSATVCSRVTPFQISFFSDNWETAIAATSEAAQTRAGFQLVYAQTNTNC